MKHVAFGAVACLVVVAGMLSASVAEATYAGKNGPIVFRRYLNDDHTRGALFTVRPDGSGIRQLTHPRGRRVTTEPDWSPEGRWVVYTVNWHNLEERGQIVKIRRNGTHPTSLASSCTGRCLFDALPAWSPSGRSIAFQRALSPFDNHGDPLTAIFVMRANGTNAHRVTQKGVPSSDRARWADVAPAWAPDGRTLAFQRFDKKMHDRQAVFTVRLDGTGVRRITPWSMQAAQPDFSPNGRWVLVRTKDQSETSGNLWLIQLNGLRRHAVTHDPAGTAKWLSASFSPDGRGIQGGRVPIVGGEQQNADVFRMRLDGSEMRNLTNTPTSWESAPDWGARPS